MTQFANSQTETGLVSSNLRLLARSENIRELMTAIANQADENGASYQQGDFQRKLARAEIGNPHITSPRALNAEGFLDFNFGSQKQKVGFEQAVRELIGREKKNSRPIQAEFNRPTGVELI